VVDIAPVVQFDTCRSRSQG